MVTEVNDPSLLLGNEQMMYVFLFIFVKLLQIFLLITSLPIQITSHNMRIVQKNPKCVRSFQWSELNKFLLCSLSACVRSAVSSQGYCNILVLHFTCWANRKKMEKECVWGEMDDWQTDGQKEGGEEAKLDSLKATDLPPLQVTGQWWRAHAQTHKVTVSL